MEEAKDLIDAIVKGISFDRKQRITKEQKAEIAALKDAVSEAAEEISALRLRLWHACYKNDYHSLTAEEAYDALLNIRLKIDEIISRRT